MTVLPETASPTGIADRKAALRSDVLARRAHLSTAERAQAAQALADQAADLGLPPAPALIAGFWPIRDEIDVRPLMAALADAGHPLALPVIGADGKLLFRMWAPGEALVPAGFGTSEPGPDRPACDPAALLVPLAAFDRTGARLGYGKGHYDGAIARLSARGPLRTVGVAFAVQEVDEVPMEPHDRRLDAVLTEAGLMRFSSHPGEPDAPSVSG